MHNLPPIALSVRQPWAWAIVFGGKVIENRSLGSIRAGKMVTGPICIHAASGMTEQDYRYAHWRLQRHSVACPRPEDLIRSAIIGTVEVVDIVTSSESEWFGGQVGLVVDNPKTVPPVPSVGALGYYQCQEAGAFASVKPWMRRFARHGTDNQTPDLFPDAPARCKAPPVKP